MIRIHRAIRRKSILFGSFFGVGLLHAPAAMAATVTANAAVNVTVAANCTVTTTAVNFGSVNIVAGSAVDALGGVNVICTMGVAFTISAGVGNGSGATFAARKMTSGVNTLTYSLFTDYPRTAIWGDGTGGTATFSAVGNDNNYGVGAQARIFAGQTSVRAGNYSDVVVVTVTY